MFIQLQGNLLLEEDESSIAGMDKSAASNIYR